MEYKFTEANFQNEVLDSDIPVLVDFYADWCGPCKMMMPVVEKLAEKYDGKVNQDLAAKYGIMSIPSFLIFKKGTVVETLTGAMPAEVLASTLDSVL